MSVRSLSIPRPGLAVVLFAILAPGLWLAGGASRPDVLAQPLMQGICWLLLITLVLVGRPLRLGEARPLLYLLCAMLALALLQAVPLPPSLWLALPGRALFAEAAAASGQAQPWRPWAIVPGGAVNAALSLIVPITVLLLLAAMKDAERRWLPATLLALITASMLIGLLQFSGTSFNNPLMNDTPGQVSGSFANRNHFALFMAIGCLVAPAWAYAGGRQPKWRAPMALGLVLLFALTILGSGSRAGILLGILALGLAALITGRSIRRSLSHAPRWVFPALIVAIVTVLALFVVLSISADRAVSINRALTMDAAQDMRRRGLPTVLSMVGTYFPFGSGLGGFDPLFRIHEPFALLKPTYFNHAHNDFLEIVLQAGLPGGLLLLATIGWWAWASVRAWRVPSRTADMLPRLGSAIILLVLVASAVDYPARTPMIMAVLVIAATWLNSGGGADTGVGERGLGRSALPRKSQHL